MANVSQHHGARLRAPLKPLVPSYLLSYSLTFSEYICPPWSGLFCLDIYNLAVMEKQQQTLDTKSSLPSLSCCQQQHQGLATKSHRITMQNTFVEMSPPPTCHCPGVSGLHAGRYIFGMFYLFIE